MLFPTPEYALFFLAVFAAAWALVRRPQAHKALLLAASYGFYAWWDWRFLPLLFGISLAAAIVGRWLQLEGRPAARKAILVGGIAIPLLALATFKYLGFAASALTSLLEALGLPGTPAPPSIALPIGISFFAFHAISLVVDAWRGRIPVPVRTVDALLYVAFFPQLVAGPILRAASFLPQLARPPDPSAIDAARALQLIVTGLVKKVLIATFLATRLVDPVFGEPGAHSGLETLLAIYGYAAQVYCDFSGYTDMAIGSALLLGYRFPDNFDAPYSAASLREYWHRWHISLSTWLRDYLFIPLGGSRSGRARTLANLAITMVLGGLWHGAAWTFVIWGALQGAGLAIHRLWEGSSSASIQRLRAWSGWAPVARFLTFHFVCLGYVLFRSPTLEGAGAMLAGLATPTLGGDRISLAVLLAIAVGIFGPSLGRSGWGVARARFARMPLAVQGLLFALIVLAIEAAGPRGVAPFIYFQF